MTDSGFNDVQSAAETATSIGDANNNQAPSLGESSKSDVTTVSFFVKHGPERFRFSLPGSTTLGEVKQTLVAMTDVPVANQKLIFCGVPVGGGNTDARRLDDLGLPAAKATIMLVGATQAASQAARRQTDEAAGAVIKAKRQGAPIYGSNEADEGVWCQAEEHRKVLELHGQPEDSVVGIMDAEECMSPDEVLGGLCDKRGQRLRLRVKPETGELWLATKEVTHKFFVNAVNSQSINQAPGYHIMAFQAGPTTRSRFFVYWVPSQYVESIKTMVLQHKLLDAATRPH